MNAQTAVAVFQPPRLPFHAAVEERFGVDKTAWKALVEAVFPSAQTVDAVVMALAYCKRRNLDVFKKPVHIVPVWDSKRREMIETVWPGIAEMRTTAMRTGQYAGKDKTSFGPPITTKLAGVEMTFPEWAQITLYRTVPGIGRCAFEGPEVCWMETYATAKRDTEAPNSMWRKRPRGQLEKCAEAAALRCAFPEELGNEYAAEEMEGRSIGADGEPITIIEPSRPRKLHAEFEDAEVRSAEGADPEVEEHVDQQTGEVTETPTPPPEDKEGVTGGHARPNEAYFLAGEKFGENGRRQTYKDGRPFSSVGPRASIPVYAEHAPIVGQAAPVEKVDPPSPSEPASIRDNPGDRTEVAEESSAGEMTSRSPASSDDSPAPDDEAEFEDITDPFVLFDENVGELGSWAEIKASLAALRKSEVWPNATKGQVQGARRMAWLAAKALMDAGRGPVDPGTDATAFLCWLTVAKDKDEIDGTLKLALMKSATWKALSEVQQEAVLQAADEAKALL